MVDSALLHILGSPHLEPAHGLTIQKASRIFNDNSITEIALLLVVLSLQILKVCWHLEEIKLKIWCQENEINGHVDPQARLISLLIRQYNLVSVFSELLRKLGKHVVQELVARELVEAHGYRLEVRLDSHLLNLTIRKHGLLQRLHLI